MTSFALVTLLSVAAASYVGRSTQTIRDARHSMMDVQTTNLCEAGVQEVLRDLWRPFKVEQNYNSMEGAVAGASPSSPRNTISGEIPGVGRYSAGVIGFYSPGLDPYARVVVVRSVGWIDTNGNGVLDPGEARKIVDVAASFELRRSAVFDYTYFVNNYGWMKGFNPNQLIVNGDMRANGDFEFSNGSPTVNGSVVAAINEKLTPAASGLINQAPVKWTNANYNTVQNNVNTPHRTRQRQAYNPAIHGAIGSDEFRKWRDLVYFSDAQVIENRVFGAAMMDSTGYRGWQRTNVNNDPVYNTLGTAPTEEVVMPDLQDLSYYLDLSANYSNPKAFFQDGTPNPNFGEPAYVETWDPATSQYVRHSVDGVVNGSVVLVGTATHPIRINGPVTITQDVVIKGHVQGQGTLYSGRNTHVVGSIRYVDPPNFLGTNMTAIENNNEKKTFLGMAARGSVIMGNPSTFTHQYPLQYMSPPFTKGRFDDQGNFIPPFNAYEVDSSGRMRYQSVVPDSVITSISEGINQIDAIVYTNFVGGGNVGVGGGGVTINGSLISKDEAMVVWSLPMRMNYDNRIRERGPGSDPLIQLDLPRSPTLLRSTWQERGFRRHS